MQNKSSKLDRETALLDEVSEFLDSLENPENWPARPPVDDMSIKVTAFSPDPGGRDRGLNVVDDHHKQVFRRVFGALESRLRSYLLLLEASQRDLELQLAKLHAALKDIPEKIEIVTDGLPWGTWDRCKLALILVSSGAFIGVDTNSIATTLQESGIPSFQSPLRAWCFSAAPLAVAVCLKLLRDCLDDRNRRIYARAVTSLGIVSGFVWLYCFSTTFPNIAQSPSEIVGSFSLDTPLQASGHSNNWLVFFGLTTAIAAAAASWTAVESMVEAHRIQKRIDDPEYEANQSEIAEFARISDLHRVAIARARSFIERIEMERQDLLAEAQNVFNEADAGVAYSRDALIKFKNLARFLLAAFVAGVLSTPAIAATQTPVANRLFIVAASPYLAKPDRELGYRETVRLVLDGLSPGDSLTVLDGVRFNVAAEITIPEGEVFRKNANARVRACARELAALRQFFAAEVAHAPEMEGVIHVPQVLALSASHLRKPKQPITVLVFGSPFYADDDRAFNMLGGYVPSDEHLRVTTRQSVYGTADKAGSLDGVTVHYAYLHETFEHADHRQSVGRLWSLFVQRQAGTLASFAASPAIVFRRAIEGAQETVMDVKLDENDRQLVMRRTKHVPAPTPGTQTNKFTAEPALQRQPRIELPPAHGANLPPSTLFTNVSPVPTRSQERQVIVSLTQTNVPAESTSKLKPSSEGPTLAKILLPISLPTNAAVVIPTNSEIVTRLIPESVQAGKQGIAIVWSVSGQGHQGVDVDLRVRPPKSSVELSFLNKEAPVGRHLRDVINASGDDLYSQNPKATFEYVELNSDVSLRDTAVWLNLFRNDSSQAVQGVIIVVTKERILQRTFRFPAALCGDRGSQAPQREENPNWVRVELAALLNRD